MSEKKMEWKDTLNLPRTDFPMKAQLSLKEPETLKKWEAAGIYEKILENRDPQRSYILHDGPPYANGNIHLGTALNKILKDFVVKSRSMAGFYSPYVPGWDCHGLPIEHKVDQKLGARKKNMTQIQVREECRLYAEKFLDSQRADFKRLGVFGDWQRPYTTLDHEYEATVIHFFNSFVRQGNVYRKKRPVYWCLSCRTALAEAEVEYHDHSSPSITVKFPLRALPPFLKEYSGRAVSMLIWTTTPWTIPANLAIAVHAGFDYALFEMKGELYIAASALLPAIAALNNDAFSKLREFKGRELDGLKARHPLFDRDSLLINTDYVLLDQGTGCVHTAPGHGEDDYHAGVAHGLDIYSPVLADGRFDETAGPYQGLQVFQANERIVDDLRRNGSLLHAGAISHSYPHCWRCKKPVIYRATAQWFIAMDHAGLRAKALDAIQGAAWLPAWGEERIASMVANRPDWCISRQRDWGVPLPAFFCRKCEEPLLDPATIENVEKAFAAGGSNSWYSREASDFIVPGTACPACGGSEFEKGRDILDVWFESGSSHGILRQRPGHRWPADMYLEGGDQYRGWFHSSLLVGVNALGGSPYRAVITHGWVLDAEGKTMHKSLGNAIEPQDIIKDRGAEILRLWSAMVNYQEDVRLSEEMLQRLSESYRKIRNTWRFMLGVLADYDPQRDAAHAAAMDETDRYILQRLQEVKARALKAYQDFEYHAIFHALFNFFTNDLSSFYLNFQKDNLYCNRFDAPQRRASQHAVFTLLRETLLLLAPILSFTCEEAWGFLPHWPGKAEFIHLERFPQVDEALLRGVDAGRWERVMALRDRLLKEIEAARARKLIGDSLEADIEVVAVGEDEALLRENRELFRTILVIAGLDVRAGEEEAITVRKAGGRKCPRCWNWVADPPAGRHPELCPRCAAAVPAAAKE
ncbi:MAG: isoleucine--tRNA ligase [Acidobacteria bacterium]|jgi:isoleucyl-tRNA synthetase|nr:isoleucine--tRNA ligase [Acidobacteriota bacterium]